MSGPARAPEATSAGGGSIGVFAPLAADYAAARPGYPAAVFEALLGRLPRNAAALRALALDVAAGTGAATRGLLGRGLRVIAVEPALEMLRPAVPRLAGQPGWLGGLAARAEVLPVRSASAAAIVVAQAFHWLQPKPALDEFARVLAPAGVLLLLWNVAVVNAFVEQVWELVESFNPGHERPVTQRMRGMPEPLAAHAGFRVETTLEVEHERRLSVDDYLRYTHSWSYVGGAMNGATLEEFTQRLKHLLATHHGKGPVTERFVATAHFARRL